MKWYFAAPLTSENVTLKRIIVGRKKLVLIKYQEEYFALNAYCPHAGADLSGGWCKDGKIICPFHRYAYDIKTGRGDPGQNDYVDTYPTEVRDDGVYVGLQSFWDIFDSKL
ncbi:Rieske (2Fe-2S) protein [Mucilaginibacter ginkgonis]|uniref:Rieske (2Fe-2S) protein n=1 Tax=Mucilaginibacter ginkgonis TaxID=2682091 RepID=A0A6I4HY71_9SPHI|nr:Rieske (2Fe-2S) protein [Mucilaginibacter ginkgonis]QQL51317.1 Rieske (2Fe-2S) protein [Mucilaginibacter ginkgonis]